MIRRKRQPNQIAKRNSHLDSIYKYLSGFSSTSAIFWWSTYGASFLLSFNYYTNFNFKYLYRAQKWKQLCEFLVNLLLYWTAVNPDFFLLRLRSVTISKSLNFFSAKVMMEDFSYRKFLWKFNVTSGVYIRTQTWANKTHILGVFWQPHLYLLNSLYKYSGWKTQTSW